jgi:transcriptional regulator with XRE-family HTH domain
VDAQVITSQLLERSGLTKTELCARAGISRSLLDGYLKGRLQPSVAQLDRVAQAAGLRIIAAISPKPRPVSAEYFAVMELAGQLAGKRRKLAPLGFPHAVWKLAGAGSA